MTDYSHVSKHPYVTKIFCWICTHFSIQSKAILSKSSTSSTLSLISSTSFLHPITGILLCMLSAMVTWSSLSTLPKNKWESMSTACLATSLWYILQCILAKSKFLNTCLMWWNAYPTLLTAKSPRLKSLWRLEITEWLSFW